MSIKLRKENFMNLLLPYRFQFRKVIIINYLSEIYANYHKRCNKVFDSYSYQELMKLPMIVCNKIFLSFKAKENDQMSIEEFSNHIYNLFFGDIDDKMSMMFDIFDFDGDGSIIQEDVFLILSHFHLMEYNLDTIDCIEIIISNFFENKKKIEKENCFNIGKNFDALLLLLLFLNKYQSIISEQELSFYESIMQKSKNKNNDLSSNYLYSFSLKYNNTIKDFEDLEYQPSNALLNYLDLVDFGKKRKKIIMEEEEGDEDEDKLYENEDPDLNALIEFSMDFKELKSRFINECNLEPKLFTSTFSSMFQEEKVKKRNQREQDIDEQVNNIYKNQIYNNFIKKEKINKKIHNNDNVKANINNAIINTSKKFEWKKKRTEDSNYNEKTTHINSITELDNYEYKKSNSIINSSGINFSFIRKFNPKIKSECEIILNKESSKTKKKMVKLILFNNCIFYYIKFNKTNFLYKKIIPIVNMFIHKKKIDDLTYMTFISQTHNTTTKREFSCDDYEKVYNFCLKFNNFNCHRDITKDYYFKYELDKGKFGHVFLANKEEKKVAIKLVQKTDQSFEEYKINRNEIDIFHLLQNIKHPNIVECIDLYENESQIFFVFEYLSNGNLKKYIQDLKLFPQNYNADVVLKLSLQIIEGMNILHKFGIIHRDIKTTNIMVKTNSPNKKSIISSYTDLSEAKTFQEDMSDVTLKIIDFGLSKILGVNETTNEPYGSLSYKAPELIMHKDYNSKVDVWSLGITIYYITYKMLPFEEGNREDVKNAIINNPVPYYANNILYDLNYLKNPINTNNKYDKEFKSSMVFSILKDCLIKNPSKRYDIEQLYYKYCNFFK